jgi:predicted Zn-ribbon and HTH transcriptional regulator
MEKKMNRSGQLPGAKLTLWLLFVGLLWLTGGLIFLCAAVQNTARLPIALTLLVLGGLLVVWAGIRLRQARQLAPDVLDERITDLAAAHDAEVTVARVMSALNVPEDLARTALARLETSGLCHQEQRQGKTVYVFPGLKESKVVRRCTYCGNEYSVRKPLHKCPNCGGTLELINT